MGYKRFASMNIAIIGLSEIAEWYAAAFIAAGHEVFIAWKDGDNANLDPALQMSDSLHVCSIEDAACIADLVVIATVPKDVREVSYWLGDVRRKVIIDATSNVFSDIDEQVKTVCAIKAITGSQHIVKAFHTKGYEHLLKPLFNGAHVELLLAGDSKKAKEITKILATDLGISNCYDFGGNDAIPLFNAMTTCWRGLIKNTKVKDQKQIRIPFRH